MSLNKDETLLPCYPKTTNCSHVTSGYCSASPCCQEFVSCPGCHAVGRIHQDLATVHLGHARNDQSSSFTRYLCSVRSVFGPMCVVLVTGLTLKTQWGGVVLSRPSSDLLITGVILLKYHNMPWIVPHHVYHLRLYNTPNQNLPTTILFVPQILSDLLL